MGVEEISPAVIVGAGLVGASVGCALSEAGVVVHLRDRVRTHAVVASGRGAGRLEDPIASEVKLVIGAVPPVAMRWMRFMLLFLSYLPPQRRSRSAVLWHRASNVQTYYIICNVW